MYDNNTIRRVEQILGYLFAGTQTETQTREYSVIDGVAYVDLFSGTATISTDDTFTAAFNGRKYGIEYYNELRFDDDCNKTIEVTANWGSNQFMTDIDGLLSWVSENEIANSLDNAGISSKKIEDTAYTFKDSEQLQKDLNIILHDGYGFYIRRPFILDVAKEQRDAGRYF